MLVAIERTKWQLTQTGFDMFLSSLDADREAAGEKYLLLRRNLLRFFEGRGFSTADEAADEVLNRITRKIETGESIENINQYIYGVARMLILELRKKDSREQKALNELPKDESVSPEFEDETGSRLDCLNCCLHDLPEENRRLIVTYYQGEGREKIENRQKIAEELGIPQNALRNRAVRLRDKLELCLSKCVQKRKI